MIEEVTITEARNYEKEAKEEAMEGGDSDDNGDEGDGDNNDADGDDDGDAGDGDDNGDDGECDDNDADGDDDDADDNGDGEGDMEEAGVGRKGVKRKVGATGEDLAKKVPVE